MTPSEQRKATAAWRRDTIRKRRLDAELDALLEGYPAAAAYLDALSDAQDIDALHHAMLRCAEVESELPSQGWRIAWTAKVEPGAAKTLAALASTSDDVAADAFWDAAAAFADGVATSPLADPTSEPREYNIGWMFGTGKADAAIDAYMVILMDAYISLVETKEP